MYMLTIYIYIHKNTCVSTMNGFSIHLTRDSVSDVSFFEGTETMRPFILMDPHGTVEHMTGIGRRRRQ